MQQSQSLDSKTGEAYSYFGVDRDTLVNAAIAFFGEPMSPIGRGMISDDCKKAFDALIVRFAREFGDLSFFVETDVVSLQAIALKSMEQMSNGVRSFFSREFIEALSHKHNDVLPSESNPNVCPPTWFAETDILSLTRKDFISLLTMERVSLSFCLEAVALRTLLQQTGRFASVRLNVSFDTTILLQRPTGLDNIRNIVRQLALVF